MGAGDINISPVFGERVAMLCVTGFWRIWGCIRLAPSVFGEFNVGFSAKHQRGCELCFREHNKSTATQPLVF